MIELLERLPAAVRRRAELEALSYGLHAAHDRLRHLSPAARSAGRAAYFSTLARNLRLAERARQLLDGAEAAGLRLLPIKGALFADALYDDPGLRPMSDLDLLCAPADLPRLAPIFRGCGFEPVYGRRARFTPRHGHDIAWCDARANLLVELHYRLHHELVEDARSEPLFARAIEVETMGRRRRVPSWPDHLMLTCVHAATHAFGDSPMWLFDAALLLPRAGGWDEARREATRRGAQVAFDAAARLASRLLGLPSPDAPRRLRDPWLARILGPEPLAASLSWGRSLAARALLTDRPGWALAQLARKAELRLAELGERRSR